MLFSQLRQRVQRAIPIIARLVRINRRVIDDLAGGVDDGDLASCTQARVEAHRRARTGRCGQQQRLQVQRKDIDRFDFGALAQLRHQFRFKVHENLHAPGPAHGIAQPFIGWPAFRADAETR